MGNSARWSAVALCMVIGCTEATNPDFRSTSLQASTTALAVDRTISVRVLPNLDGNNVTVTAFNRTDVVTGFRTTGTSSRIFRSQQAIQYFTPPAGFQPGGQVPPSPAINSVGRVVGGLRADTALRAFVWGQNGGTTLLQPTYPFIADQAQGCGAQAITDSGYVGGYCFHNSNVFIAEWRPDLSILHNDCCGVITAMTENRYLTGYALLSTPQAFVWKPGAAEYAIIDPAERRQTAGLAVNLHGWVAGWLLNVSDTQAVLWVPGQPTRILSHLGQATGIDAAGNIVGFHRDTPTSSPVAFLWNFATGAHFLPGLPGGRATAAVAISNVKREILGWATDAHGLKHAVIWSF